MAITYTLEEAADKLGLPPEEFRKRLKTEWSHLRPMRDGSTLRFKDKDIEELGRQIGLGSEEELQLNDPSGTEKVIPKELGDLSDSDPVAPSPMSGRVGDDDSSLALADDPVIQEGGEKEVFLLADDKAKSKAKAKSSSDSDVRLEKTGKVKKAPPKRKDDRDGTDEIDLDVLPPSTSPSGKMTSSSTKLGSKSGVGSGKIKPTEATKEVSSGKSGKLTLAELRQQRVRIATRRRQQRRIRIVACHRQ